MTANRRFRTLDDLLRVVRALAYEFNTDTVFVVGSQAILASMPDAPEPARASPEIDAFPANAQIWEIGEALRSTDGVPPLASEHIDGLFGQGSQFDATHGFYIDGVDETTAKLPPGWQMRAVTVRDEVAGRTVFGVAPGTEDLIASKVLRLENRDKVFVEAIHAQRPLDLDLIEQRILEIPDTDSAIQQRAVNYIRSLRPEAPKLPWSSSDEED
ncbi:DUF6036 family nucleotidyltransferase [Bradyrhizobium sp. USDA 4353]